MAIFYIYGIDVTIQGVSQKGNFDQTLLEVENLSKISEVYLSTKDQRSYSLFFKGRVRHLSSPLFALPDTTLGKSLSAAIFFVFGFVQFLQISKKIDVIVSQGTTVFQGAVANFLFHKPVVLSLGYFAYNEQCLLGRNLLSRFFKWIELFSLRHCSVVIATTEKLKKEALASGAKVVEVIPNFVNMAEIDKISEKEVVRKKLGFVKTACVLLFVGRLHPVKNLPFLLKSFRQLGKLDECVLVIIGDGPERQSLKDLACKLGIYPKIRFEGFKSKKQVFEYMKASDVLVLPSLVEGQPRVVLEAWANGLPVVASRVLGIKELIIDGFNGLLFDLDSQEQCVKAISKVLENDVSNLIRLNAKTEVAKFSEKSILSLQKKVVQKFLVD